MTKLFSPELHKCYFLYIPKQICSKVPVLLYFVGPKRPSGNCYVSCFLTDKTALGPVASALSIHKIQKIRLSTFILKMNQSDFVSPG